MEENDWKKSQFSDLIWELTSRDEKLTRCWLTALRDVGIDALNVDGMKEAIGELEAVQPRLAQVLQDWLKRQEELQPLICHISSCQASFEASAAKAMEKLLQFAASTDTHGWTSLIDANDLQTVGLESRDADSPHAGPRLLRASGFLLADAEHVFNHVWAQANQVDRLFIDLALARWADNNIVFELRTQLYRLPWPLDNRETLTVRMGKKINDNTWAVVSTSVDCDIGYLARKDSPVRANVLLDGYVIEQIPHKICRVVRIYHFDPVWTGSTGLLQWAQESRFGVTKSIETLRDKARDGKLEGVPIFMGGMLIGGVAAPLAATGVLSLLGFGAGGIVAGSWAAGTMGAAVVAGSPFAMAQSAGVVGIAGGPLALLIASGAVLVGGASFGIYHLVKHVKEKAAQQRVADLIAGGRIHVCQTCGARY